MAIKSKNRAKIFLGGGQMIKIRTKLYFFFFFTSNFFSLFFFGGGGTMAHPGPPLPPSLTILKHIRYMKNNRVILA